MEGDPVVFVREAGGICGRLFALPDSIPTLRDPQSRKQFESGRDFAWSGKREICLTPDSRIPFLELHWLFPPMGSPNSLSPPFTAFGRAVLFSQGDLLFKRQILADYSTTETILTQASLGSLPLTREKIRRKGALRIAVIGDSLSKGEGAKLRPGFAEQVATEVERQSGISAEMRNYSVSGTTACGWGEKVASDAVSTFPDLVILSFGVNDASNSTAPEKYADCISKIIEVFRKPRPQTEFVIVGPLIPHPSWASSGRRIRAYANQLRSLKKQGVALADMTSVWEEMLRRKRFVDITSNGINHPNDYSYQVYYRVLTGLLGSRPPNELAGRGEPFFGPSLSSALPGVRRSGK